MILIILSTSIIPAYAPVRAVIDRTRRRSSDASGRACVPTQSGSNGRLTPPIASGLLIAPTRPTSEPWRGNCLDDASLGFTPLLPLTA